MYMQSMFILFLPSTIIERDDFFRNLKVLKIFENKFVVKVIKLAGLIQYFKSGQFSDDIISVFF